MSRRGWWLAGIAAVVAVPLVAVTVAIATLDADRLKPALVSAVAQATGRTLTIDRPIRLSRSLWPTLELSGVKLGNLPGGSRPDMVRVERISAQLDLFGLLHHVIDIQRLRLVGPNILFEQVAGQPNWVFDRSAAPAAGAGPAEGGWQVEVRRATVKNGMVTWRLPARTKVIGVRTLDYQHEKDGGPFEMTSTLVYSDNAPFKFDVRAQPTGGTAAPWQTTLHFAAFDTDATATGTMQLAGAYDLQVDATSGALERLNALLPEMGLPPVHGLALQTRIGNGRDPGDLPVIGQTRLSFASADLGAIVPGLSFGATKAALDGPGAAATAEGVGTYNKTPFHLKLGATIPTRLDGPVHLPLDLQVDSPAPAALLALKGTLSLDTLAFAGLDAQARLRTAALAGLRPVLGDAAPALTKVAFDGHVQVPKDTGRISLRDAALDTAQGDLAGAGTIGFGLPIDLTGRWRSKQVDLDAMLEAFGISPHLMGRAPATGPMIPDTALPWAVLRGPHLDLALDVASMPFQGEVFRNVQLPIRLGGGHLQVSPMRFDGAAGRVELQLSADGGAPALPISFAISAPALPLGFVLRTAGLPDQARGTARVELRLQGAGRTVRDVARSLDGTFWIAAVDGSFSHAALLDLAAPALKALGTTVPRSGETRLDCFGLAGRFDGGVATLRTIALQTDALTLEGSGTADLGRETLDLTLTPLAEVAGSGVKVPVVVRGPFRNVSGVADVSGLDKIGLLFNGLTGGDRATACADVGLKPAR